MAQYNIKRASLSYSMGNEAIFDANDVFSFRLDEAGGSTYWCGFYDDISENYLIFPSDWGNEMICLSLDTIADEALNDFETRLCNLINNYSDTPVRLVAVADDCSIMNQMKWI